MEHFIVHGIHCYAVKPCARCVITTTDQETGMTGREPLKSLASYRRVKNEVWFGQNVLSQGNGLISVGDPIEVIKTKTAMLA